MSKKWIASLAVALGLGNYAYSQGNFVDILRYSERFPQGTARTAGCGNAFGALGADFGAIDINPGGLGLFQRPELNFTLALNHQSADASYLGTMTNDDHYNFNISNLGLVIPLVPKPADPSQGGWMGVNMSIGYNRTNNFSSNITLTGENTHSSILYNYRQAANGFFPSELESGTSYGFLAYQNYLINPITNDSSHYTDMLNNTRPDVIQKDVISTTGAMNNIALSVAGNYNNRLYIGAQLGIPTVGFHSTRTFSELNVSPDTNSIYRSSSLTETVHTSGMGLNATLGAIVRINDIFRVGASVQTPNILFLHDDYSSSMTSSFYGNVAGASGYSYETTPGTFSYNMVTPMRATLSAAALFGKVAFISVDYEYVDYPGARFGSFDGSSGLNSEVKQVFQAGNNFRFGAEYRFAKIFSVRAGYDIYSSPYKASMLEGAVANGTGNGNTGNTNVLCLGLGFNAGDTYMDIAYQRYVTYQFWQPYNLENVNYAVDGSNITNHRSNIMVTMGFRF